MHQHDTPAADIQLIDFTRTGSAFNAYLVTPSGHSPCDWGQASDMTRAQAIKLARAKGYEPTVRHAHQVWLRLTLTAIARAGYQAHDAGTSAEDSPYIRSSPNDTAWRVGWAMAQRGYVIPSLNDHDAIRIGRGNRVHVRSQVWTVDYGADGVTITRAT